MHGYYDLPPWSLGDRRIAFTRMVPGAAEGEVWLMEADGSRPIRLAESRATTPNDGAMAQWSADGRRIYFRDQREGRPLLAWVDVSSGERGEFPGDLRMLSPVGGQQAWHSRRSDYPDDELVTRRGELGVFIQDLATGQSRRVAGVEECLARHPRRDEIRGWHLHVKHTKWTPDGLRILFVLTNEMTRGKECGENPAVKDLYVIEADGTGLRRVGPFGHHPIWHPNGRQILANCPLPGREGLWLVLMDALTGERRLATEAIGGSGHPSYSPDGTRILLDRVRDDGAAIFIIDLQRNQVDKLAQLAVIDHTHQGTHLHPVWRQDGRQVLFASDVTGCAQLCVIDV